MPKQFVVNTGEADEVMRHDRGVRGEFDSFDEALAFAQTLPDDNIAVGINHDQGLVLAVKTSGVWLTRKSEGEANG